MKGGGQRLWHHTIQVTGVSDELLQLLDDCIRARHEMGRSVYIGELMRNDVLNHSNGAPAPRTFRDLLDPVAQETRQLGETEEKTEELLRGELEAQRRKPRARSESYAR